MKIIVTLPDSADAQNMVDGLEPLLVRVLPGTRVEIDPQGGDAVLVRTPAMATVDDAARLANLTWVAALSIEPKAEVVPPRRLINMGNVLYDQEYRSAGAWVLWGDEEN